MYVIQLDQGDYYQERYGNWGRTNFRAATRYDSVEGAEAVIKLRGFCASVASVEVMTEEEDEEMRKELRSPYQGTRSILDLLG